MTYIGFTLIVMGAVAFMMVPDCYNGWRKFIGMAFILIGVGVSLSPVSDIERNPKNTDGKIEMTILGIEQQLGHGVRIIGR